jgi:hypothetical protein
MAPHPFFAQLSTRYPFSPPQGTKHDLVRVTAVVCVSLGCAAKETVWKAVQRRDVEPCKALSMMVVRQGLGSELLAAVTRVNWTHAGPESGRARWLGDVIMPGRDSEHVEQPTPEKMKRAWDPRAVFLIQRSHCVNMSLNTFASPHLPSVSRNFTSGTWKV